MCEMPTVFAEKEVRARVQHRCCECTRPIVAGDNYVRSSGLWNSRWSRYKTCSRCAKLRTRIIAKYPPIYPEDGPYYGGLREYISNCR